MTPDADSDRQAHPDAAPETEYDAIVYDLDGTLVRLAVDWDQVASDAIDLFADAGVDADGAGLWDLLERAPDHGLAADLEDVIASHERAGARESRRLPLADAVGTEGVPVGVCSLNAESACRIALETHGLADPIRAVVGRDTVGTYKPDPEPLLATLERIGVDPARGLFVGDSERDAVTAERAGVPFRYADEYEPEVTFR